MRKINNIFITGTMRTGGSLLCNLLNMHKEIFIVADKLHFFRHIYSDYRNFSQRILFRIAGELSIRLKYRFKIFIPKLKIFNFLLKQSVKSVGQLYSSIIFFFSIKIGRKIVGEYANCEWRNIENFLNFNERNIAIQVIRDPRGVISSWKKITFSRGVKYLNAIFNWIDSVDHALKYKKKYPKRFKIIRFEDIHNNPKKISKQLCKFIGVNFDNDMVNEKKWNILNKLKLNVINISSYKKNEKVIGFSKTRIDNWKNNLYDWEICLIDFLCNKRMKKLKYKTSSVNKYKNLSKALVILKKDTILRSRYNLLMKKNIGTDKRILNPKDPKTWEFASISGKRFSNTLIYKRYLKELMQNNKRSLLYEHRSYG